MFVITNNNYLFCKIRNSQSGHVGLTCLVDDYDIKQIVGGVKRVKRLANRHNPCRHSPLAFRHESTGLRAMPRCILARSLANSRDRLLPAVQRNLKLCIALKILVNLEPRHHACQFCRYITIAFAQLRYFLLGIGRVCTIGILNDCLALLVFPCSFDIPRNARSPVNALALTNGLCPSRSNLRQLIQLLMSALNCRPYFAQPL